MGGDVDCGESDTDEDDDDEAERPRASSATSGGDKQGSWETRRENAGARCTTGAMRAMEGDCDTKGGVLTSSKSSCICSTAEAGDGDSPSGECCVKGRGGARIENAVRGTIARALRAAWATPTAATVVTFEPIGADVEEVELGLVVVEVVALALAVEL